MSEKYNPRHKTHRPNYSALQSMPLIGIFAKAFSANGTDVKKLESARNVGLFEKVLKKDGPQP